MTKKRANIKSAKAKKKLAKLAAAKNSKKSRASRSKKTRVLALSKKIIKINIITHNNQYGLSNDIKLLINNLKKSFYDKYQIAFNFVNFYMNRCPEADINIFLEIVNGPMTKKAKYNIFVPNQEWFYKHWEVYLDCYDMILCKTHHTYRMFSKFVKEHQLNTEVKYISWSSIDRYYPNIKKDYKKILHLCGRSIYKNTQLTINAWKPTYPELYIVFNPKFVKLKPKLQDNIKYLQTRLDEGRLTQLMNVCGIHLCCSSTEGFGHYLNEAKSAGAVVLTTDAAPMNELITTGSNNGFLVSVSKKVALEKTFGYQVEFTLEDFQTVFEYVTDCKDNKLKQISKEARYSYMDNEKQHRKLLKQAFSSIFGQIVADYASSPPLPSPLPSPNNTIKNTTTTHENVSTTENTTSKQLDNLPHISIATPTYNRKQLFKMAIYNYKNIYYPKDKFEWVVVDDSDIGQEVEDILPNEPNIKYIRLPKKLSIGAKRNACVANCNNSIILFMDDDDYYYPESANKRIEQLLASSKSCVYSSTIGCFHINKYISLMNVPPHNLPFNERVSEATLTFKKDFWERQKFDDKAVGGEAIAFLKGRFTECHEIESDKIIVSLLHSKNTSHKELMTDKPNGCHFGFSDDLFLFVTGLDNTV